MKHIGMARLGRDAEIRYTPDGTAVCNLSLATSYYDKNAENNRATQWIDATMWGQQAERLAQFMVKGSLHCFTLTDMRLETYDKNDGGQGVKLVARVADVELGPRADGGQGGAAPARQSGGSGPATPRNASAPRPKPAPNFSDMDDDIPF